MSGGRFHRPPAALRRARLDNLVLVPASQLPFKEEYQQLANSLPGGTTLIVLPRSHGPLRQTLETTAQRLRSRGRRVHVQLAQMF